MSDKATARALTIHGDVLRAIRQLADGPDRRLLGLVGAPAAGKSTLAAALVDALAGAAIAVPMDGFHLSQQQLERLGRAARKGAPDTFDGHGYRDLLARLRRAPSRGETVYAPGFYREIEEPIAASIAVLPETPLVITEGNYLLLEDEPWPGVAAELDAVWYLDIDLAQREARLIARHVRFGRSDPEARAWVADTDRPNADRIAPTAAYADRILRWRGCRIEFAGQKSSD